MSGLSLDHLVALLIFLIALSGVFSASEIGMMSLNRYRLRHLVKKRNKGALRVDALLKKPDRLLGVILIGNTLANIVASAIATLIGQRLYGDSGVAIATGLLTFVVLVFAEMAPKGLAARRPEAIAFPTSIFLGFLLKMLGPLVVVINVISELLLRLCGFKAQRDEKENLTHEELITVVNESGNVISGRYKNMLRSILDLEALTVEDLMLPKSEIVGIDFLQSFEDIKEQLEQVSHTRIPIYRGSINQVEGLLHAKTLSQLLLEDRFNKEHLSQLAEKPYFIVEGTSLFSQLCEFQKNKKRIAFVVDEYGDVIGLLTLEAILEEVVGEFTTKVAPLSKDLMVAEEGYLLVNGAISLRELQKALPFQLPETQAKTLNGLITEILGSIPPAQSSLKIENRPVEILKVQNNRIKMVKFHFEEA